MKPSLSPGFCFRGQLLDYADEFFPGRLPLWIFGQLITSLVERVTAYLSEEAVTAFIDMNAVFTNNTIEVEMSSGPQYPIIYLRVTEFRPLKHEVLSFDYLGPSTSAGYQSQSITTSYSPPLGLYKISRKELRLVCLNHIKAIIEQDRQVGEVTEGDISIISWRVFETVNRYRKSSGGNGNVSHSSQLSMYMS